MHPGETVTKNTFAAILKEVLAKVSKPESVMSSFLETGLFPFNPSRADVSKTTPSTVYIVTE